jgi:hypothetical protein
MLQRQIPFTLDLHDGAAYVSLVAFTLRNMRINHPRLNFLTQPLHTHDFLNVRTYVRVGDQTGIFFLAEWLNNRLATTLGPILYGLPYRFGELDYHHDPSSPMISGQVRGRHGLLGYHAVLAAQARYESSQADTLSHFLLERYIAFTQHGRFRQRFRVAHEPWPQISIDAQIDDDHLLHQTGPWFGRAQFCGAHFSPGVDVQMGWPQRLERR